MLPSLKQFREQMMNLGVRVTDRVILYCRENNSWAARVYWTLRIYGHKRVQILNGGLRKWMNEGRHVETNQEDTNEEEYNYKFNPDFVSNIEDVHNSIKNGGSKTIIDARPAAAYNNGHIKGAINIPFSQLFKED